MYSGREGEMTYHPGAEFLMGLNSGCREMIHGESFFSLQRDWMEMEQDQRRTQEETDHGKGPGRYKQLKKRHGAQMFTSAF